MEKQKNRILDTSKGKLHTEVEKLSIGTIQGPQSSMEDDTGGQKKAHNTWRGSDVLRGH